MAFVWVPGGCFLMGCGSWAGNCYDNEKPVHEVCVDGFLMGMFEVTQGQWQKVMGGNYSSFNKGDDYPVNNISWNDAQKFIRRLSVLNKNRYQFRLPTEAEWEYACRSGGKPETYSGGSRIDLVAWYNGNSASRTHRVGTKSPNGLGLYDMSGNVCEWCEDWYEKDFYSKSSKNNPECEESSSGYRVLRGASWNNPPMDLRCGNRNRFLPGWQSTHGFRLIRLPQDR